MDSDYCFLNQKFAGELFGWQKDGKEVMLKKPAGKKAYGPYYPVFTLKIRNDFHVRFREFHLEGTKLNKKPDRIFSARGRTYIREMFEGIYLVLGRAWINNSDFPLEEIIKINDSTEYTPFEIK